MRLKVDFKSSKTPLAVSGVVLWVLILGGALYFSQKSQNPLPSKIKNQVGYKVIYPSKKSQIDTNSYNYHESDKTVSFVVDAGASNVVFTEQPAPESLGTGSQPYYPSLGIHPYAQFKTKLGMVALTKFWQSSSLEPFGQSAVLASHGTFLIAHTDKNLTNAEWKDLFDSLKISK